MKEDRERLDKILAAQGPVQGLGSRRDVKKLIRAGLVRINGQQVYTPETKVRPGSDTITVGGRELLFRRHLYIMLNKPRGVVSSVRDSHDSTVMDILPPNLARQGLFPVGRLDKDTEGLLLITDDGELAHKLTSPRKGIEKTYFVRFAEVLPKNAAEAFLQGIRIGGTEQLPGELCLPARLEILNENPQGPENEALLTIREGKYHQVKRMFAALGSRVTYLKRLSTGPLRLDPELPPGEARELTAEEIDALKKAALKRAAE